MNNEKIIEALQFELKRANKAKEETEKRLFENFTFRFPYDSGKLLAYNQKTSTFSKIIAAEGDKKEHLEIFIGWETKRVFEYDCSNKSTSTLSNYQREIEIETTKELINLFKSIVNE